MTDRTLDETKVYAKAKIDAFYDAISASENLELQQLPKRISRMNARASVKVAQIHIVADKVFRHAEGRAACARGCAHCCYIAVLITATEAKLIGERIGVQPKNVASTPRRSAESFSPKTPCPFLKNYECSVYESRPLACRSNYNFDQDNYWCKYENWDKPGAAVPKPGFQELHDAYSAASKQRPADSFVADIRDYFPNGLSQAGLKESV